jgi:hypothetical protein
MNRPPISYVKLLNGEKVYAPDADKIGEVLEAMDSENNSQVEFFNADGESITVFCSGADRFYVCYERPQLNQVLSAEFISLYDAITLIKQFLENNPAWQSVVTWNSISYKTYRKMQIGLHVLGAGLVGWLIFLGIKAIYDCYTTFIMK